MSNNLLFILVPLGVMSIFIFNAIYHELSVGTKYSSIKKGIVTLILMPSFIISLLESFLIIVAHYLQKGLLVINLLLGGFSLRELCADLREGNIKNWLEHLGSDILGE